MQIAEADRDLIILNLECQQESYQGRRIEHYQFQNKLQKIFSFYWKKWKFIDKF